MKNLLLFVFCFLVFLLTIRGIPGNPKAEELNTPKWRSGGPFEQTGRFALLYSYVENNSFQFSLSLARFATPDLAMYNGKYVSLFAPGVSFLAIPGYLIGKYFGLSQVGTFAVITLFAICNIFLIRAIARKIGIHSIPATIGGLVFAFATPAFPYAVDLYQHHISTFFILFSIYSFLYFSDFVALFIVWLLFGASVVVDYPNFLMMLPIVIYASAKIFTAKKTRQIIHFEFNLLKLFACVAVILPLIFFLWFNKLSYNNPFILSGTLPRVTSIDLNGKPSNLKKVIFPPKNSQNSISKLFLVFNAFNPRLMLNGFYIHFLSKDRGMLYYTPVMFFGFLGGVLALRKKVKFANLLCYTACINIFIYSMWGDPWGGWAFGSRYLIPSYAILAIFVAYLLSILRANSLFLIGFFIILSYSVVISALGALTSSLNPPKIEAEVIAREAKHEFKYSYDRNIDFLNNQGSKSFIFNVFGRNYISSWDYYIDLTFFILSVFAFLIAYTKVKLL